MHELSMVADLIVQVNKDAVRRGQKQVESVTVALGSQSHIGQESLCSVFNLVKEGTLLSNAQLVVKHREGDGLEIIEYSTRE